MPTIVVSSPMPGRAVGSLSSQGHQVISGDNPAGMGHDALVACLREHPETEAVISLLTDKIDAELLQAGPKLRIVANCAVGIDNLDLAELRARKIVATNTPGVLTDATADLAFALLLDACRRVSEGDRLVRSGGWTGWAPTQLLGMKVSGATLGIIGFGRIGRAVARRASGFGMSVIYYDAHRAPTEAEETLGVKYAPLDEVIRECDVLTLHCPLTPETRGLLSRDRLASMRKGAVVVNTARGPCLDEQALAELLTSGHLAAAGLDVYQREPQIHPALLGLQNVVLAPHIGSADRPTRERMAEMCVEAVTAVLAGRTPNHVVT
ncbi:MAG: D-glycerate dehydrogenase [Deltaproteobacteria bacterium]|nr:D-glycerate dehydrogenase [Deltaproteobacteria bacterium]